MRLSRLVITALMLTVSASAALPSAAQVADVLSFMMSTVENDSVNAGSDHDAAAALDVILGSRKQASAFGSLDYITGAFTAAPFTATGTYKGSIYTPGWGRITSGFGFRKEFGRVHRGIDVSMNVGDTVRAPLPGLIEKVGYEAKGYGHYVVMIHDNGVETRYAHLSRPLVSAGQQVFTGQPIALSGNSGNSTGPHLHFETRQMGIAVDPRTVFDFTSR